MIGLAFVGKQMHHMDRAAFAHKVSANSRSDSHLMLQQRRQQPPGLQQTQLQLRPLSSLQNKCLLSLSSDRDGIIAAEIP